MCEGGLRAVMLVVIIVVVVIIVIVIIFKSERHSFCFGLFFNVIYL